MKKLIAVLLIMSFLSGCSAFVDDTYLAIEKHSEHPTEPTENVDEEETIITNRNELRGTVLSRIRDWVEHDVLTVQRYDGDLNEDLAEIVRYATDEDPIGAYAVDFIDVQLSGSAERGSIELSIVFRRSAAEVDAIITISNTANALRRIQSALISYETALTLRIRNYEEVDFEAHIREYCLKNMNLVLSVPEMSAEVYPPTGETRILELHFTYPATRDEMRTMLSSTNTILTSAANYVKHGTDDFERIELLTNFLTARNYTIATAQPSMPAYELLCEHVAHSMSFAAVFRYECALAGVECWHVTGTRNGQTHEWNIVCVDGVYYHVDLMRNVEQGETALVLLSAEDLQNEGYAWQTDAYPTNPEPVVPYEPTTTTPTEIVTQTDVPTENTEPTEEVSEDAEPSETEENN